MAVQKNPLRGSVSESRWSPMAARLRKARFPATISPLPISSLILMSLFV